MTFLWVIDKLQFKCMQNYELINKYFQNDDHCQPGLKDFVGEKHLSVKHCNCQKSTNMSFSAASQRKCVARLNSVCLFHRFKIRALIHNVAEYINGWGC